MVDEQVDALVGLSGREESPGPEKTSKEKLLELPLQWHEKFDKENDPLKVYKDLEKWNEQHPEAHFTLDEFMEASFLFFFTHDLVNIIKGLEVKGNELKPAYFSKYTQAKDHSGKTAEERGQEIVEFMIRIVNNLFLLLSRLLIKLEMTYIVKMKIE